MSSMKSVCFSSCARDIDPLRPVAGRNRDESVADISSIRQSRTPYDVQYSLVNSPTTPMSSVAIYTTVITVTNITTVTVRPGTFTRSRLPRLPNKVLAA